MTSTNSYETYNRTHRHYDETRLAVGNEQLIGLLGSVDRTKFRILDAGCGTGLQMSGFEAAGFRNLTGIDASVTGLAQSAQKLKAHLICGDIRHLPFASESFDMILFSFVIHHLPYDNGSDFERVTQNVLFKSVDCLAPGGRLAIITCLPEQLSPEGGCMWYYKYFPEAAAKLCKRFLHKDIIENSLRACGLGNVQSFAVTRTYWTDSNLDLYGPFSSAWRSGDSLFAFCAEDPFLFALRLATLNQDILDGKAQRVMSEARARAESIKQAVIFLGTKY